MGGTEQPPTEKSGEKTPEKTTEGSPKGGAAGGSGTAPAAEAHAGKDSHETAPAAALPAVAVAPAEAGAATAGPLVLWPEASKSGAQQRTGSLEQDATDGRLAEWLALEPQAGRRALADTLADLTAPEAEIRALGLADDRSASLQGGGSANGGDGSSSTEGHSTAPTPGPGPGGSGGGSSAAGGGAASGSSASSNLVSVFFNVPASVMLRLGISERSARQTFFLLIPEKPD